MIFNAFGTLGLFLKNKSVYIVTALAVTVFFGCESNFKEVQKNNVSEFVPTGEADSVNLKYTDSGAIRIVLLSSKMLDYSSVIFPFTDFPKGIHLTIYEQKGKKTTVTAQYAISYSKTSIIDLRRKVVILSEDGPKLETEQLFYDQKNQWFYTEKKFKFSDAKGVSYGQGIDFSKDFKVINSQKIEGEVESLE
jgi:LPS export ABC transporter protein LptC